MMSHVPTVFIVAIEYNNFCNKPSPQVYYDDSNCCRGLHNYINCKTVLGLILGVTMSCFSAHLFIALMVSKKRSSLYGQ